jgi:hypothetical protein
MSEGQTLTPEVVGALTGLQALLSKLVEQVDGGTIAVPKGAGKTPEKKAKRKSYAPNTVGEFISWFIKTPEDELYSVRCGQWQCIKSEDDTAHLLMFHSKVTSRGVGDNIICIRPIGCATAIFNASRITYGNSWRDQKQPQEIAEAAGALPIPFETVVSKREGAGLALDKLQIVDWSGPEDLLIPPVRRNWNRSFDISQRHFAGAAVVKVEDEYFLFDTDREEVDWFGFNPFFTQLPTEAVNVKEAYSALMPEAVHQAQAEGKEVIRQGEFFFVPVEDSEVSSELDLSNDTDRKLYEWSMHLLDAKGVRQLQTWATEQKKTLDKFRKENKFIPLAGNATDSEVTDLLTTNVTRKMLRKLNEYQGLDGAVKITDSIFNRVGLHMNRLVSSTRRRGTSEAYDMNQVGCIRHDRTIGAEEGGWSTRHVATATVTFDEDHVYARGCVTHSGREHRPVLLNGWHRVYSNTATNNWTVSGDVD